MASCCECRNELPRSKKMRVISWPADNLLASQERDTFLEFSVLRSIVPETHDGRIPSVSRMIVDGTNLSTRSKTYPSAVLSTTNPT